MFLFTKCNFPLFQEQMELYGRGNQFPKGLVKLFMHLEDEAREVGFPQEVDIISICCQYSELTLKEVLEMYHLKSLEELQDATTVLVIDDETVIIENF